VYCFYPETSYLNLESVDLLFLPNPERDQAIEANQHFWHKAIQWNVVPTARMAVNEAKALKKSGLALSMGDVEAYEAPSNSKTVKDSEHAELR
jgi:hypothetical protein